jgi:hypothetical protein
MNTEDTTLTVKELKRKAEMRDLVQTIMDYGVNNTDIKNIIYFLALELEEVELFQGIPKLINSTTKSQKSGIYTGDSNV